MHTSAGSTGGPFAPRPPCIVAMWSTASVAIGPSFPFATEKRRDTLNDRALNYDLFQGFEESVIDMYSAVRHGYLQRRQQLIKE